MKDLSGLKFNRLYIIGKGEKAKWNCLCDCGKLTTVSTSNVKNGSVKSCGCLHRENVLTVNKTHGKSRTKEYRAWSHAKGRCYDKNDPRYRLYGACGITMCDAWKSDFGSFYKDMGDAPDGFTLERKDRTGNYCKENCIWANRVTQANNTCSNHFVMHLGESKTLAQWAVVFGLKYKSLHHLYVKRGLSFSGAIENATKLGQIRTRGGKFVPYCAR